MKDENKIIAKKISSLDSSPPEVGWNEDGLWDHIERRMRLKKRARWIMYAAACISMLVSFTLVIHYSNHNQFTIEHTVETSDVEALQPGVLHDLEASTLEFIRTNCKKDIEVCKSAEFKALTEELNALETEIASLENMISIYGNDPSFVKSKIQIENLRSEIIGKLVQMILS